MRIRLTVASISMVAVALFVAGISLVWAFERHLIVKTRERDRMRAVQEVAGEVYKDRFPVAFFLLGLPSLEVGTIVRLIEGDGEIFYSGRDSVSLPDLDLPRLFTTVKQFMPHVNVRDEQRVFETMFKDLETCLATEEEDAHGWNNQDDHASNGLDGQPLQGKQALKTCRAALHESFLRTSKVFAFKTVRSEIFRPQDGNRSLITGAMMIRPDAVTPVLAVVVTSLKDLDRRVNALRTGLMIGGPLGVGVLGILSWLIIGRSLRPVEAMRREVVAIAHTTLDRRVPEPQVQDEVGRLARTMNEMLDRLERAAKAQRRFVSDASHELRSPLTSMRAQLEVALAHPDRADWQTVAQDTLEESLRMQHLIDELLDLARMDEQDSDSYIGSQELLDLDDIVFAEVKRANNRKVRTEGVSAGRVRGNPDQLRRVLRNLLDNAERYARSEIRIWLETVHDRVILVVEDDGPGIPVQERERIFARFARGEESRSRREGGVGLGLAVVRGIVVRHGGYISVTRASIGGARFELSLPTAA